MLETNLPESELGGLAVLDAEEFAASDTLRVEFYTDTPSVDYAHSLVAVDATGEEVYSVDSSDRMFARFAVPTSAIPLRSEPLRFIYRQVLQQRITPHFDTPLFALR